MKKLIGIFEALTTIAGVCRKHLPAINSSMRTMAYSQAAVDFAIVIENGATPSKFMALLTFSIPTLIMFGFIIGLFSKEDFFNERQAALGVSVFTALTSMNTLFLLIYFSRTSWLAAISFFLGIFIASFIACHLINFYYQQENKKTQIGKNK